MKWVVLVVRSLVGLVFFVFGLNYFIEFMPIPKEMPERAAQFMGLFGPTNYLLVVKVLEVLGGLILLSGRYVPLGLVILGPIIVNILLFDLLIMNAPALGVPLTAMLVFLVWAYRASFAGAFQAKNEHAVW